MNLSTLNIIVYVIIAIFGWLIVHFFTNRSNKLQTRRDLKVEHLISAYRILTNEISHRQLTLERELLLENILTDIQLFGSKKQIILAKDLIDEVGLGNEFQLDPLINSLRNSLRKELDLSFVDGNVRWLRFKK